MSMATKEVGDLVEYWWLGGIQKGQVVSIHDNGYVIQNDHMRHYVAFGLVVE